MQIPSLIPNCYLGSFNQTYCYVCNDYYVFDPVYTACVPNTKNCSDLCAMCPPPNTKQVGCKCVDGFAYDIFDKTCGINPFGSTCLQIAQYGSGMICYLCDIGYVLSSNYKSCIPECTVQNCDKCYPMVNNYCVECSDGYYPIP